MKEKTHNNNLFLSCHKLCTNYIHCSNRVAFLCQIPNEAHKLNPQKKIYSLKHPHILKYTETKQYKHNTTLIASL